MQSVNLHKTNLNRWEQQRYAAQKCLVASWQLLVGFGYYPFVVPYERLGWQHIVRFRLVQSVVRFLRCLGQTVIPLFSSSGTSN